MGRRFRWTVLALVVVLVTGIVILVITVRPGLQDDAQEVRRSWKPLLQPLAARYSALNGVVGGLNGAGNGDREITRQLDDTLDEWDHQGSHRVRPDHRRAAVGEALQRRGVALRAQP
jgi:hypothetical protein